MALGGNFLEGCEIDVWKGMQRTTALRAAVLPLFPENQLVWSKCPPPLPNMANVNMTLEMKIKIIFLFSVLNLTPGGSL